jgi:hypothetical protein
MISPLIPNPGIGKERSDVNPITSSIIVQAHIDDLLAEAAKDRIARSAAKPESRQPNRFAGSVRSVWSNLFGSADQPGSLPTLANYPYRG